LVVKDKAVETHLQAITKVQVGEVWLEPTMVARVLGDLTRPQPSECLATLLRRPTDAAVI